MIEEFPYSHRKWVPKINLNGQEGIKDKLLRVTSYNILADHLLEHTAPKESIKNNEEYLTWEYRRSKILNELKTLNSDIICCQELVRDEKFIKEMGNYGYNLAFKPRTGGTHSEGCAIFWKYERFDVENLYCLEFNTQNDSRIYSKDNVCVFAIVKDKRIANHLVIIATTHILFNQNRGDTKIAQVKQILSALSKLEEKYNNTFQVSTLLTGDFNSIPNSGIYKFITEGKLNCSNLDIKKVSGQLSGLLQNYDLENNLKDFRKNLQLKITNKFDESRNNFQSRYVEKCEWIYDLLSAEVTISNDDCLILKPVDRSRIAIREEPTKILYNPFIMKSSYAENLRNMINLTLTVSNSKIKIDKNSSINWNHLEFLKTYVPQNDLNYMEIYGTEISLSRIGTIYWSVLPLTLEPSNTFFAKNLMTTVDYIFYKGNLEVVCTLNTPDVYQMLDMKNLPNKIYPSDHISISTDFIINI